MKNPKQFLKLLAICTFFFVLGIALNHYHPINTEQVTIDNWQTIDAKRIISKNDCEAQKYQIRAKFDKDLKLFLHNHGLKYKTWEGILESNTTSK